MKHWNDCCEHLHRVSQQDIMYQKIAEIFLFAGFFFLLAGVVYYLYMADLSLIIIFYGPKIKGISSSFLLFEPEQMNKMISLFLKHA